MPDRLRLLAAIFCLAILAGATFGAEPPVRVVVWDEQQPAQKKAYDGGFLGEAIAAHLRKNTGLSARSVKLDDADQGLPDKLLEETDVLVWWGHVRNRDVKPELAKRIVERIKVGKLSLIALHSAHWSPPFVLAMNDRTTMDAIKSLPETERAAAKVTYVYPKPYVAPKRTDPRTPSWQRRLDAEGKVELVVNLPSCVFPAYRADGKPSHVKTLLPEHPIAEGIPAKFDIAETEMYDEPFHVPEPDAVIFEETWDAGEHFRSGCVWGLGKGKIFYFRPGHETYGVYKQEMPLKVVENAAQWLGAELPVGK
jgi:trehalose utilization protein